MKQNMAELSTRFGNMKQNIAELLYKRDQSLLFTRLNPNNVPYNFFKNSYDLELQVHSIDGRRMPYGL